jgi:glycosyltransferase involved in cell wall biosynthesis
VTALRADDSSGPERALLLVRNGVRHDARVLRAAHVLRDDGYAVLIAGVETAAASAGRELAEGIGVVRVPGTLRPQRGAAPAMTPPPAAVPGAGTSDPSAAGWTTSAAIRRSARAAAYARGAIAVARAWRPDLIHANDHNTMWPALAIRAATGAHVLYDSHELWADRNGRPEWRTGLLAAEALFVRAADAVITASPGYSQALADRHGIPAPAVVRNIPRLAAQPPAPRSSDGPPEIVYVGGLMRGRGLEVTIAALALLPGVRLRLVGPGSDRYASELQVRAAAAGVADRVTFAGAVPPGGVVAAVAGARVGLALIEPICRSYELTLPNKLFEYVHAGVPVLSGPVPVLAGVVHEHGLGAVSASLDVDDVAAAVRGLLDEGAWTAARARAIAYAEANTWDGEREQLRAAYRAARG